MRVNFRQGIVSHQSGSFLSINGSGHVDLLANNKSVTVSVAHKSTDYIHSEDNTVPNAWIGPFNNSVDEWLYFDFNRNTFDRSFGTTTIEPVAQSAEPGTGNVLISGVIAGDPGIGSFVVQEHYVLSVGKSFNVLGSTGNDGIYTVASATFNGTSGETTIVVDEIISDSTADGSLTLDVDSSGVPLLIDGRHWYDTSTDIHYLRAGGLWVQVLRIFVARVLNNGFLSLSIDAPAFTGTQIGNTNSVLSGRVLFSESFKPLILDDGTFVTTENQLFTNQSRTDGIRLESNVVKAKSATTTLPAFSVVAYIGDAVVDSASYNNTGSTVLGLLTETILVGEVGSIILQGVVTNPTWSWLSFVAVGSELWVDNGMLVTVDPHVTNPVVYPVGQVPIARVLGDNTIVFEQGLGGKGDRGPVGSLDDLPPATVSVVGGCTLVTPSSDIAQAFVISDTDPRLADARNPLPHAHQATDILFTPGFGIDSNNLQAATEELAVEKLNLAGGIMSGILTLSGNPTTTLEAATKQYVDSKVSGLVWIDPIDKVNLIADDIATPPLSPERGDAYIIPAGATGVWTAFTPGHVTTWDGTLWIDNGPIAGFSTNPRFGIAFITSATPSGTFLNQQNNIAIYDIANETFSFEVVVDNNAVYVRNVLSEYVYDQFAFSENAYDTRWTQFSSGQNLVPDETTIGVNSNIMSVIPASAGGTVDANTWQGIIPTDLDAVYAAVVHSHPATSITTAAYNTSLNWGILTNTSNEITATQTQIALENITDNKAAKTPTYATQVHLPNATSVEGMIVYVQDIQLAYIASNGSWVPLIKQNDTIKLPYDLAFFITGGMQIDVLIGSFLVTRSITITAGAPASLAIADNPATVGAYTLDIIHRPTPLYSSTVVGTILFNVGTPAGIITWNNNVSFIAGDLLQIRTPLGTPDTGLKNITITIVGCAPTQQCGI